MSRILYIVMALCTLLSVARTEAQTISLGERTPRFKQAKWLNGNVPEKSAFTYVEFIHSASISCRQSAERLHAIVRGVDDMTFVLISHQSLTDIDNWVTEHIDKRSGVIFDDIAIRASFGVNYAPYAVILDRKRRALWFGNPQFLDKNKIEKLITK